MNDQDKLVVEAVRLGNDTVPKMPDWLNRNGTPAASLRSRGGSRRSSRANTSSGRARTGDRLQVRQLS